MNSVFRVSARAAALGALACAMLVVTPAAFLQGGGPPQAEMIDGAEAVPGEVLVKFRRTLPAIERRMLEQEISADRNVPIGRTGARRIRSGRHTTSALLARMRARTDVEYA